MYYYVSHTLPQVFSHPWLILIQISFVVTEEVG